MGQQQLLLLILGVIIVAIAVSVGISMARDYYDESIGDEIRQELLLEAQNARTFASKPKTLGGGGGAFTGYTLPSSMIKNEEIKYRTTVTPHMLLIIGQTQNVGVSIILSNLGGKFMLGWGGQGVYQSSTKTAAPF
ncbi:MAG: hypothetical protein ACOYNS_14080 [Bacteroidota bacterium]